MIRSAPAMGWMRGHRVLIPRHVLALDRSSRQIWMRERGITPVIQGSTHLSGIETLNVMEVQPTAVGPTASLLSVLGRECLKPVAPGYFENRGQRLWMKSYGVILTTATVPTFQLQVVTSPTYGNPLGTGQMLAQNVAITPAAALTGTLEWFLDVVIRVNLTGSVGSLLAIGTLFNDWVTALTFVNTTMKNAVQASAVAITSPGLLQPLFFDLEVIMGLATAGNTVQAMDYWLGSIN